jgi:hypothetical protein
MIVIGGSCAHVPCTTAHVWRRGRVRWVSAATSETVPRRQNRHRLDTLPRVPPGACTYGVGETRGEPSPLRRWEGGAVDQSGMGAGR